MTSTEPISPGSLIDGRYRVDELIGEGGFGRVFRGMHLILEAPIAIKTLRLDVGGDEAERAVRFLDEAKLLSKLRHPHIVRVIDAGVHASTPPQGWLVVEWCDGVTLGDDLAESAGAARSVREVWELLGPLVDAVAAAHEANIVHRDIKPSNVMLTRGPKGPEARLIDFGIAKAISQGEENPSESKTRGRVAFTTAYAAPEQLAASRTGPWTDVHALGLLLTEVLTGAPPYPRGEELHAILDQHERPTPKRFGVDVGAWEAALARAVAFKGTDRFESARELHDALERALPDLAHDRTSAVSAPQLRRANPRSGSRSGDTERETSASLSKPRLRKHDPSTITAAASSREVATAPSVRTPAPSPVKTAWAIPVLLGLGGATWALVRVTSDEPVASPSGVAASQPIAPSDPEVTPPVRLSTTGRPTHASANEPSSPSAIVAEPSSLPSAAAPTGRPSSIPAPAKSIPAPAASVPTPPAVVTNTATARPTLQ